MKKILLDPFLIKLILVVTLASILPAYGQPAEWLKWITIFAIALLFFLHGARLSREAIVAGMSHWRLHLTIFSVTFVAFPVLALILAPLTERYLSHEFAMGLVYLGCLPATVQSAIAFTSMARGNVPAAICSASASNLLGVFLTPVLVGFLVFGGLQGGHGVSLDTIGKIMLQLLFPFVLGHLLRPKIGAWVTRNNRLLKEVDQGSILLVVYTAFSDAVINGLWHNTSFAMLTALVVVCCILLALVMGVALLLGRIMKFSVEDRITLFFAGSKKSLATGIPMANILFAGSAVGAIVLPLMIFHQIQLMVCAIIASHYSHRPHDATSPTKN